MFMDNFDSLLELDELDGAAETIERLARENERYKNEIKELRRRIETYERQLAEQGR